MGLLMEYCPHSCVKKQIRFSHDVPKQAEIHSSCASKDEDLCWKGDPFKRESSFVMVLFVPKVCQSVKVAFSSTYLGYFCW